MRSMTGYGAGVLENGEVEIRVDLRSINSRYLDIFLRLPKMLYPIENDLRRMIANKINRGKLEVNIRAMSLNESNQSIVLDKALAKDLYASLGEVRDILGMDEEIRLSHLLKYDIIKLEDINDSTFLNSLVLETMDTALNNLIKDKEREGAFLKRDILEHLVGLKKLNEEVYDIFKALEESEKERLRERVDSILEEYSLNVSDERLLIELAILLDKRALDEEILRLISHIEGFRLALDEDVIGKRLDFLVQEMNREVNTILSKTQSLEIKDRGVLMKSIVEKIREQLQNVE